MALAASVHRDCWSPMVPSEVYSAHAATQFYEGSIVAVDTTTGLLVLGQVSTTLKVLGVSARECDTATLDAADRVVPVDHGTFGNFTSAGGADAIAADDIKKPCYVVDDDTVALTDGGSTRSFAGTIHAVNDDGSIVVQFEVVR